MPFSSVSVGEADALVYILDYGGEIGRLIRG